MLSYTNKNIIQAFILTFTAFFLVFFRLVAEKASQGFRPLHDVNAVRMEIKVDCLKSLGSLRDKRTGFLSGLRIKYFSLPLDFPLNFRSRLH